MSLEPKAFIQQISKMGQREIARSFTACTGNLLYAGGAGLVTAGTVALKFMILHSPLTLVVGAVLSAINFILSFVFMQAVGFRLATKQSPLLGAALGRSWQQLRTLIARRTHLRKMWRTEVSWTFLTQVFSASGNLLFVIPAAFVLCTVFRLQTGTQFLDPQSARAALASLDPWQTATLPYAAATGVLLWLCTCLGSFIAHRFQPFSKTTATLFFNIFLGAMLALVPLAGKSLGLPLDVRHFTLSGGQMALAVVSLGIHGAWDAGLPQAMIGVLAIGTLNFTVSFALAFLTVKLESTQAQLSFAEEW